MDRKTFQKALGKAFYPRLRSAGFVGSGVTRRRFIDPIIQVINVQGSQWGAGCYINLGVHLRGLATAGGQAATDQPMEYQCIIRTRLDPPPEIGRGIWPYGSTQGEATQVAESLATEFASRGEAFFARASRWPGDFTAMVAGDVKSLGVQGLNLARLAEHLGMANDARRIAQETLAATPASATALRAALEAFLGAHGAA
jgi:hypothetical protein